MQKLREMVSSRFLGSVAWAHVPVMLLSLDNFARTKLLFGSTLELWCHQCHQFPLKIAINIYVCAWEDCRKCVVLCRLPAAHGDSIH